MSGEWGLRTYQRAALDGAREQLRQHRSTLIVMPTGTGKTRVFSEIIARAQAREVRSLVLVHRDELVRQAAGALRRLGCEAEVEKAGERASKLAMFGLTPVVATVQTLKGRRLSSWPRDSFGMIVVDEAHHATAKTYRDVMEHFGDSLIIGVTATPDRGDKVGLRNVFESTAYVYEIRQAIDDGFLCPVTARSIVCDDLDISQVKTRAGDLADGELEIAMTLDRVLHQVADPLAKEAGDRPTLVFTAGVQHAHALAAVLSGYVGHERVEAIDGTTPYDERRRILSAYQDGRVQYLLNCAVLTEGFDAPHTACVAMTRPTKSRSLFAQCLGRGLRIAPGKADCLALDFVGNAGKHTLVAPSDVLAGEDLDDDVKAAAQKKHEEDGAPLLDAIDEAKEDKRRRLLADKRKRRLKVESRYTAHDVDVFTSITGVAVNGKGGGPTDKQLAYLHRHGVDTSRMSKRDASRVIDHLIQRRDKDQCTYKMARKLAEAGLRTDLSFADARRALDALAQNRWRPSAELRAEFGS